MAAELIDFATAWRKLRDHGPVWPDADLDVVEVMGPSLGVHRWAFKESALRPRGAMFWRRPAA